MSRTRTKRNVLRNVSCVAVCTLCIAFQLNGSASLPQPLQQTKNDFQIYFEEGTVSFCKTRTPSCHNFTYGVLLKQNIRNLVRLTEDPIFCSLRTQSGATLRHIQKVLLLLADFNLFLVSTFPITENCERSSDSYSAHNLLTFQPFSCHWWRFILAASGWSTETSLGAELTLTASPLNREKCACLCGLKEVTYDHHAFINEFKLTLNSTEYRSISKLDSDFMRRRYSSCAVVFSSGILGMVTPAVGELIDGHDAIIRINHAPAGGDFKNVAGARTTIRLMYVPQEGIQEREMLSWRHEFDGGQSLLLLSVHFRNRAKDVAKYNFDQSGGVGIIPTKVRAQGSKCLHGHFFEHPYLDKKPSGPHLSQGFVALLMSLLMCKRTVIFGKSFTVNESTHGIPYHYYEETPSVNRVIFQKQHGGDKETTFIRHLLDSGVVSVVPGAI